MKATEHFASTSVSYSSQLIPYLHNQHYGPTALTLPSNTVPHSQVHLFTCPTLCRHNPPSLCLPTSSLHHRQHNASCLGSRFLSPLPASLISWLSHTPNVPTLFERANYTSYLLVPVHSGFMTAWLYGLLR
jgi:hypothetical protein